MNECNVSLGKYEMKYAQQFAQIRNNPKIFENGYDKTPNPFTSEAAIELFERQIKISPAERFLIFCNTELCGEIGIWLRDDIYRLNAELGYFIAEPFWGKGIATKAINQMVAYTFQNFEVTRIVAGVFAQNKASKRALEKNDFVLEYIARKAVIKNGRVMDDYCYVKFRE